MNAPTAAIELDPHSTSRREAWRRAGLALAGALIVLFVGFWGTYSSIVAIWWRSNTFAHGFLIVPIVVYLIWLKRSSLAGLTPRPAFGIAGIVFGLAVLWLLGDLGEARVVSQFAVVAMIPAIVWAILGTRVARALVFPLAYLVFAVPIGEVLVPSLQDMTATLAVLALKWTGLPVYWEGRLIAIPTGTFEVAEACSGVRYLIACVAVGSLFAYLMYSSFWRRLAFMGLSLVVPLAANAARAYGIIMISHLSNNRLAHGIDHVIYGWIFFGVVMMLLFWIGSLFRDAKASDSGIADYDPHVYQPRVLFGWTAAIAMIALSAPLMAAWYDRPVAVTEFVPALPAGENGWVGPREISEKMRPVFHGASAERCGEYVLDAKSVNVCIVYYAIERQDAELVSSENRVFDYKLWLQTASRSLEIRAPNQPALSVEELMLQSGAERRLLWYWYNVNGVNTISDVMAKIHALRARLLRDASGSSAIILSTELEIEPTAARDTIKAFLDGMLDPIHASLKPAAS